VDVHLSVHTVEKEFPMRRTFALLSIALLFPALVVAAEPQTQAPPPASASVQLPSEYMLVTVILRHDQSLSLDEINKKVDASGFWKQFPPEGIEVASWYVVMGIGHVVTLKVPPARLREVNLSVERTAWGAYRTEFYPTYDYRALAAQRREAAAPVAPK
jgi:hypothetical protein